MLEVYASLDTSPTGAQTCRYASKLSHISWRPPQLSVRVEGEGGCMSPALPTLAAPLPCSSPPTPSCSLHHHLTALLCALSRAVRDSQFEIRPFLRLQWRVRVEGSSQTHSVPSTHSARTALSLPQKRADKPRACAAFPKRSPISDARVRVCVEFRLELVWGRPPRLGLPVRPVSCVSSMPSCCVGAATHSPHIPPALPMAVAMRWCTRNAKFWPPTDCTGGVTRD